MTRIQMIAIIISVLLLIVIVELVRRKRLSEGHCILWLLAGTALLVLSVWNGVLEFAAELLGIYFPPMVLLVSSLGFFMLILLHFSTVISQQTERDKELAQRLAILQFELDSLKHGQKASDNRRNDHDADAASPYPITPSRSASSLPTDGPQAI
ncbi:MAG: DUF2304 domain-containing protein [Chloroflexi bacterium]|nr:DUF2304 domain-containing protein [Chloroflexota bacterium]